MKNLIAFVTGTLFAIGLGISGMTDPAKVIGFLDVFGEWDGTLLFVMGGAVVSYSLAFAWIGKRGRSLLGEPLRLPDRRDIDARLVLGAMAFGAGWGLAGYCPGPALTSLVSGKESVLFFVASMLLGMGIADYGLRRREPC